MRMSTKAQYAVRAMVDISLYSEGKPVSLKDIAEREGISLNYLEQLFLRMKNGKIVKSVRGPGGGYVLARQSSLIKVGDIVASVEESTNPVACIDENSADCSRSSHCVVRDVWKGLGEKIRGFLDSISLEDLTLEAKARIYEEKGTTN